MKSTVMKSIIILLAFAFAVTSGYAQGNSAPEIQVVLGNIIPRKVNGKMVPVTRAELLGNSKLVWTGGSCNVISYTFSIMPDGKDFIGPFSVSNSSEFTPQIKKLLQDLGSEGGRVFIENIHVNCSGDTRTVQSLVFRYQ
jgi:hypothetical protein